jgi:hypothetical protein
VNAYERLLAEELPTGTFGHALPPPSGPRAWTALEQAEHVAVLLEAVNGWQSDDERDIRKRDRHHLRLVDDAEADAA